MADPRAARMQALASLLALALAACATTPPPRVDDESPVGRVDPRYVAQAPAPPAALP